MTAAPPPFASRPPPPSWTTLGQLALSLALGLLPIACRGGLDSPCRCAADCRAGLACEAEGEKALGENQCFASGVNGVCVEVLVAETDPGMTSIASEAPVFMDLPSKRDFQPGDSDSASPTTTVDTTVDTSTSTGDTSTSTGDTSTGTGDTSTSTGDTSTSTGDTSTSTGDSSSGSTSDSTSSSTGGSSGSSTGP